MDDRIDRADAGYRRCITAKISFLIRSVRIFSVDP